MSSYQPLVAAACAACSFILAGNAITQSYMTIPALLVDFPSQGSFDYSSRASLLGHQWPHCWAVGNVFFRPMSTISTIGYAFCSWAAANGGKGDWRLFALAAALGVGTIVHSAVNMQPMNDRLAALADYGQSKEVIGSENAEDLMRKWGRWNQVRVVFPLVGGAGALIQLTS